MSVEDEVDVLEGVDEQTLKDVKHEVDSFEDNNINNDSGDSHENEDKEGWNEQSSDFDQLDVSASKSNEVHGNSYDSQSPGAESVHDIISSEGVEESDEKLKHPDTQVDGNTIEDVDPFEDAIVPVQKSTTQKSAISPIEWDRISEDECENRDELHVDAPGDEFSKEEENQQNTLTNATSKEGSDNQIKSVTSAMLRQIFKFARFYMIKSNNYENIEIAKSRNVWATTKGNETRLNKAFFDYSNVLLIFSVRESGRFQGFARIMAPSDPRIKVDWVLPTRMNTALLSNAFRIKWISKSDLPFTRCSHLLNPWNENKPVKIGRDGQEIETACGEALCRLFFGEVSGDEPERHHSSESNDRTSRRNAFERLGRVVGRTGLVGPNGSRQGGSSAQSNVGLLGDAASSSQRYISNERRSLLNYSSLNPLLIDGTRLATGAPAPLMQANAAAVAMAAAAAMAAIKSSTASTLGAFNRGGVSGFNSNVNNSRLLTQTSAVPGIFPSLSASTNSLSRLTPGSAAGAAILPFLQQHQLRFSGSAANNVTGAVLSQALNQARGFTSSNNLSRTGLSQNPLLSGLEAGRKTRSRKSRSHSSTSSASYSYARERNPRHRRTGDDFIDDASPYDAAQRRSHSPRRRSVDRRRRDYERNRDHRSRSRSGSLPIDRNLLMSWNYDDYVKQVSRGLRPAIYSGVGGASSGAGQYHPMAPNHENDLRYEQRVDAFLRGIGSLPNNDRGYSRSPSRSCSYSPPVGHSYSHHQDYYRKSSSYSRSRSPSGPHQSSYRGKRPEMDSDRSYHRISPRYRERSDSRSRSPRSMGRDGSSQWRRQSRNPPTHSEAGRQRRPVVETRQVQPAPPRRAASPRAISSTSSRSFVSSGRRHR